MKPRHPPTSQPTNEPTTPPTPRRPYAGPAVVYEAPLEVRAGSPFSLPNSPLEGLLDPD